MKRIKKTKGEVNYWPKLAAIGIRYGFDVVLTEVRPHHRCLEYKGRMFETAKEIFNFATSGI